MDIKKIINEATERVLNELKQTSYSYGCMMLYFNVTKTWWDSLQDLIDEDDITRVNGTYGREKYKDAHVTLLYGLHEDAKIDELEDELLKKPFKTIRPTQISYFETGNYDVVKLEVDYAFIKELNKVCKKYPYTTQHNRYIPHMTIAYVKKGTGKKYKEKLETKLIKTLRPSELVYSDKNNKKTRTKVKI